MCSNWYDNGYKKIESFLVNYEDPVIWDGKYVEYYDNSFREIKEPNNEYNNIKYEETIGGLENIVDCNIKNIDIYKKYLKGIGNYKMDELTKIAEECNIKTMKNGKKKTKKVLYDEINMSKY